MTYDISGYTPLKAGTPVLVSRFVGGKWVFDTPAVIAKWTKVMGPRDGLPAGYEPIRYADTGGVMMAHSSTFQVVA